MSKLIRKVPSSSPHSWSYNLTKQILKEPTEYVVREVVAYLTNILSKGEIVLLFFEKDSSLYDVFIRVDNLPKLVRHLIEHIKEQHGT
jgi:hypothetical protein